MSLEARKLSLIERLMQVRTEESLQAIKEGKTKTLEQFQQDAKAWLKNRKDIG